MVKRKPEVSYGRLYLPENHPTEPIAVGSDEWFTWLRYGDVTQFSIENAAGTCVARKEERSDGLYWYAYKRKNGRLRKLYLGQDDDLTQQRLSDTCQEINMTDEEYQAKRSSPQAQNFHREYRILITKTELEAIAAELLKDDKLTRNGKDRGSVRRTLETMIKHLTRLGAKQMSSSDAE